MFSSVETAVEEIKKGKLVLVVDDEDRENEGDLVMAAEKATPEAVNFMATHGKGLICVPLTQQRTRELNLEQMSSENSDSHETAFTISVDSVNTTTGISATPSTPPMTRRTLSFCRPLPMLPAPRQT